MVAITIPTDYIWVLFVALIISFHCVISGFAIGSRRKKVFTKQFFEKNFPQIKSYPKGGYPDNGSGLFSNKLDLDSWLSLNNAVRAHMNYVEGVNLAVVSVLIAGIECPRFAVLAGLAYVVGRMLYNFGYRNSGAGSRLPGVLILDIALLALVGSGFYSLFKLGGGVDGFKTLVLNSKAK